jgi:hypothetical protein
MADDNVQGEVSKEERQRFEQEAEVIRESSARLAEAKIAPAPEDVRARFVSYVAAKQYSNNSFLAKPGVPQKAPLTQGTPIGITPISHREGDVWVRFSNGALTTDDPVVIAWCKAHPNVCRPAADPRTRAWAELKAGQTETASQERVIRGDLDVDELMFGNAQPGELSGAVLAPQQGDLVGAAQRSAEKAQEDSDRVAADTSHLTP